MNENSSSNVIDQKNHANIQLYDACKNNKTLDEIKKIVDDLHPNVNYINPEHNFTIIMVACAHNNNLDVIKYLIEDLHADIQHDDNNDCDCLDFAFSTNSNVEITKYLIDHYNKNNIPIELKSLFGACIHLEIMKYFVEKHGWDALKKYPNKKQPKKNMNTVNYYYYDGLYVSFCINKNLNVIKYLVETFKVNADNCSFEHIKVACARNKNLEIIRYLIEEVKVYTNCTNMIHVDYQNNLLIVTCQYSNNINVVKYIVENCNIDILDSCNKGCFMKACKNNNHDIIEYLLTLSDVVKYLMCSYINNYEIRIIFKKLDEMKSPLKHLFQLDETQNMAERCKYLSIDDKIEILKYLNDNEMHELTSHTIFFTKSKYINSEKYYDEIKNIIFSSEYLIVLPSDEKRTREYKLFNKYIDGEDINIFNKTLMNEHMFTVDFICNCHHLNDSYDSSDGETIQQDDDDNCVVCERKKIMNVKYYGSKLILFSYIKMFKILSHHGMEKEKGLHLKIYQPKHIFDSYIIMHFDGKINTMNWTLDEIISFAELNDMYPSTLLTQKMLEPCIINKINEYGIDEDNWNAAIEMCNKNKMLDLLVTLRAYQISTKT